MNPMLPFLLIRCNDLLMNNLYQFKTPLEWDTFCSPEYAFLVFHNASSQRDFAPGFFRIPFPDSGVIFHRRIHYENIKPGGFSKEYVCELFAEIDRFRPTLSFLKSGSGNKGAMSESPQNTRGSCSTPIPRWYLRFALHNRTAIGSTSTRVDVCEQLFL